MGTNKIIKKIESGQLTKYPDFSSGDTVEVSVKVKEGKRERIQLYEGVVIAKTNKAINRKCSKAEIKLKKLICAGKIGLRNTL